MATSTMDAPEVPILLLGDPGVGKSTFLSYVSPSLRLLFFSISSWSSLALELISAITTAASP